ncbi:MAG: hypothetical protein KatS3mg076_2526 [Candidatus Binatia bacterium]|nr:MAG: hypothetical protein KatS3mg076_2526 [Candidatus Binatia bacterium]
MAAWVLVCAVAFFVSALTLSVGFGLGTLLLPAFALFFSPEVAVASTAVVHAANNAFKLSLLWREVDRRVVLHFGLPAVGSAWVGATLLGLLAGRQRPLWEWSLGAKTATVTPLGLVLGILIFVFALFELVPSLRAFRTPPRWLPLGGVLSGFFGGLSGHQGALRAAFLVPLGLAPARLAATQAALGLLVDIVRLSVYGRSFFFATLASMPRQDSVLVGAACLSAFGGAYLGRSLLPRTSVGFVRTLAGVLLFGVALGLATGLL